MQRELTKAFGSDRVFRDAENLRVGDKWRKKLEEELDQSRCVVVIIGETWRKKAFAKKLAQPDNVLRHEILYAKNKSIAILPIRFYLGETDIQAITHPELSNEINETQWESIDDVGDWDPFLTELGKKLAKMPNKNYQPPDIERALPDLNREPERDCFTENKDEAKCLVFASGLPNAGFRHFVRGCSWVHCGTAESQEPIGVDWKSFVASVNRGSTPPSSNLASQIYRHLNSPRHDSDRNRRVRDLPLKDMNKWLSRDKQKFYFWTQADAASLTPELVEKWIDGWSALIPEKKRKTCRVFLYVNRGRFTRNSKNVFNDQHPEHIVIDGFDRVTKSDTMEWLAKSGFRPSFKEEIENLYTFFRRKVYFKTIADTASNIAEMAGR